MSTSVTVKTKLYCGSYCTNTVNGQKASNTISAEFAVKALGNKLFPSHSFKVECSENNTWTITVTSTPLDTAERLIISEVGDFAASLPHPDFMPSAPQMQDELVARIRRVFTDIKQQKAQ
ncbi:hypothetical protein [Rheinheimera maricola]|uniref:Cation transporter n=1 Tax=Rheinheimera maricola TaxID=2793282 RepID=A0ABS7X9E9_9GAMM|nr:hypothetical protein [Rheinheimera maricola]MBZ9612183.1 hypothetical protein [Rheinheimera maricola]